MYCHLKVVRIYINYTDSESILRERDDFSRSCEEVLQLSCIIWVVSNQIESLIDGLPPENSSDSTDEGGILLLAVGPVVPVARVDIGGDVDVGRKEGRKSPLVRDRERVAVEETEEGDEGVVRAGSGEVIDEGTLLLLITVVPDGLSTKRGRP